MDKRGLVGKLPADQELSHARGWGRQHRRRLNANVYPLKQGWFEADLAEFIREWVLPGLVPAGGSLEANAKVITLGSCFAQELRTYLEHAGVSSGLLWIPSELNNTFAIRDFLSWCVTGSETPHGFSYDRASSDEIRDWTPAAEREAYRRALGETDAFVFTLGLAEVWEEIDTGHVFWRGIPAEIFDEQRYRFRLTSVDENVANIRQIIELARSANSNALVVLSLSPVPLKASFRGVSCITADCASKATLRVALDVAMNEKAPNVYYWPSFEIVRWLGANLPRSTYGTDDGRSRHVVRDLVADIVAAFVESFYTPGAAKELQQRVKAPLHASSRA